jgi:hypothetical protein
MQNNPNDDVFRTLTKIMEDLVKRISSQEPSQFVGYTIITGPGEAPKVIRMERREIDTDDDEPEIPCEVEEMDDCIYLTTDVGSTEDAPAFAEIRPHSVKIIACGQERVIELPCEIDILKSYYKTRHGVMDIVCKKRAAIPDIP